MFSIKHAAFAAAALVVLSASSVALADQAQPAYREMRIAGGPRPYQYVLVRTARAERPYALTGTETAGKSIRVSWPALVHPRGTHSAY